MNEMCQLIVIDSSFNLKVPLIRLAEAVACFSQASSPMHYDYICIPRLPLHLEDMRPSC